MTLVSTTPLPRFIVAPDGVQIATYDVGEEDAPVVLAIHGFASSAEVNWFATGWVRELTRAGYRVLALDQRGHGRSQKPHDPQAYSMERLVADAHAVLDTYLIDEAFVVGYSLGARVGWHAALGSEHRITRAVLGGIPDGRPLTRFRVAEARAYLEKGSALGDQLTQAYIDMTRRAPENDLAALIALVEGLQDGLQPDPAAPPAQPVLFATGSEDGIFAASQRLAALTPKGQFFEIPGRNHFNAPTARAFRDRALDFLQAPEEDLLPRIPPEQGAQQTDAWTAGIAALLLAASPAEDLDGSVLRARLAACWPAWVESLEVAARIAAPAKPRV